MKITVAQLRKIAGGKPDAANLRSVVTALDAYGTSVGMDLPHRLAHFIAQVAHESGGFRFDREIWGPTPAQVRYDTRTDLGNTPEADGDGKKNAGRGPIQLTGGANIAEFEEWCRGQGFNPPDFTANPDLINTDPWEGLSAIFYWSTRNLNALADKNNIEQITKRINGGLNGFVDRLRLYTRTALVLLGYEPDAVADFQTKAQAAGYYPADAEIDNDPGPKTRAALHLTLAAMSIDGAGEVEAGPVVVENDVPVTPKGGTKTLWTWLNGLFVFIGANFATFLASDLPTKIIVIAAVGISVGFMIWKGQAIARRIKAIVAEFGQ